MKTVTIPFPSKSDSYEKIEYPAGEHQIRLLDKNIEIAEQIVVQAKIKNQSDIVDLLLLADAIHHANCYAEKILVIPYLPFARADRRFVDGDCFGLNVFARMINSCNFEKVVTLDVHSRVSVVRINNLVNVSPLNLVEISVRDFGGPDKITVLLPDKGAAERYPKAINVVYATKKRNPATGKLTGFDVPETDGPVLIVDDICDGGGTFIGIANEIKKTNRSKIGLYVTHGIFSKGLGPLVGLIDQIYTTDSFMDRFTHDVAIPTTVYYSFLECRQ